MGLTFDAIHPEVYPVAYKLFESGMKRHWVAGEIFKQFGPQYGVPESDLDTAMIDLSISCAENDYKNKLPQNTTGYNVETKNLIRLAELQEKEN